MFNWEKVIRVTRIMKREAWVYDTKSYLGNVSVSWHPLVKRYQAVWDDLGISVGTGTGFFDSLEEAQEACEKDAERILQHVIEDLGYTKLKEGECVVPLEFVKDASSCGGGTFVPRRERMKKVIETVLGED